jgi:hypothetical protein
LIFKQTYSILLCFLITCSSLYAQEDGGKRLRNNRKNPVFKTRLSLSPVIGFYKSNVHHTSSSKAKASFNFSIKEEIRLDRNNMNYIMIGAEYMMHGLSFSSYYFYKDSLQLYTPDRLKFKYDLLIHEVDFPIQLKHSFQKETNSIFSSYLFAGYVYRWIVASKLKVSDSETEFVNKRESVTFKNPAFSFSNCSFFSLGYGFQKNTLLQHNAVYAELQFRYGLSPFYFNESFTPSSLYTSSHFLFLTVGIKI